MGIISTIPTGCFEPHYDMVWAKEQIRPLAEPKSDNGNIYGKQHRRSKQEVRKKVGSNRTEKMVNWKVIKKRNI